MSAGTLAGAESPASGFLSMRASPRGAWASSRHRLGFKNVRSRDRRRSCQFPKVLGWKTATASLLPYSIGLSITGPRFKEWRHRLPLHGKSVKESGRHVLKPPVRMPDLNSPLQLALSYGRISFTFPDLGSRHTRQRG